MDKKQNPTKKKQKKPFNIYKLFTLILLIILLVVAGVLLRDWFVQNQAQKQYEDLAAQVNRLQSSMNDNAIRLPSGTEESMQSAEPDNSTEQEEDSLLSQLGINVPERSEERR